MRDRSSIPIHLAPLLLIAAAFCVLNTTDRPSAQDEPPAPTITTGSKQFPESQILGELAAIATRRAGYQAEHRAALGGTAVVWSALRTAQIDIYAEYTGTLLYETFANQELQNLHQLRQFLEQQHSIGLDQPLGFNNSYGLAMKESRADELGITRISDLANHTDLVLSINPEASGRADVWPGIFETYELPVGQPGIPISNPRKLEHEIGYRSLRSGEVDIIVVYTTDAKIISEDLRVLQDDRAHFARYDAVYVYRLDLLDRAPEVLEQLSDYADRIDEPLITRHNALVEIENRTPEAAAAQLDAAIRGNQAANVHEPDRAERIWKTTTEHLFLSASAVGIAIALAVPLGVASAKIPRLGAVVLAAAGVCYTIPSLALIALMVPFPQYGLGLGTTSAIVALVIYALLPIIRSTQLGFVEIDRPIRESAHAIGLDFKARLVRIELPLAARSIMGGIKTATVITIGYATLGAFIGAGGYGDPILTGLRRLDNTLILEGAIPAAIMALFANLAFAGIERIVVPKALR